MLSTMGQSALKKIDYLSTTTRRGERLLKMLSLRLLSFLIATAIFALVAILAFASQPRRDSRRGDEMDVSTKMVYLFSGLACSCGIMSFSIWRDLRRPFFIDDDSAPAAS